MISPSTSLHSLHEKSNFLGNLHFSSSLPEAFRTSMQFSQQSRKLRKFSTRVTNKICLENLLPQTTGHWFCWALHNLHTYLLIPLQYGLFIHKVIVVKSFHNKSSFGQQLCRERLANQHLKCTQQELLCLAIVINKLSRERGEIGHQHLSKNLVNS